MTHTLQFISKLTPYILKHTLPSARHRLGQLLVLGAITLGISIPAAATLDQQVAVGVCQATAGSPEAEFTGASYIIASNMDPGVEFICPINGHTAPPEKINSATVYLLNASSLENASVELCFTNLSSGGAVPSETCGKAGYSSNLVASTQAIKVGPSKLIKGTPLNAFLKVWMPAPFPAGYAFLRGFMIN